MALREVLAFFGVEVDTKELEKGNTVVDQFRDKVLGIGKVVAGAFAVDAVLGFGKEILLEADALAKQSLELGVSTVALQGWQHAAALSGSSAQEFTGALRKLSRNVAEAGENAGGPAAEAFKALGVEVKDSAGNLAKPIELLDGIAEGLAAIEDPAKRTQVLMDLFGRSGSKLLPLFNEGPEGIKALRAEVGELGASFDEAFLENAQEYNDNVDRLKLGLKGFAIQAIGPLLPYLAEFTGSMVKAVKGGLEWLKGTRLLQAVLTGFTAKGVVALAAAIPALIAKMGGWRLAFATLGRFILRTMLPLIALEDLIGFFMGDDSQIGHWIDQAFGAGSQEKVREFFSVAAAQFAGFAKDGASAYEALANENESWVRRVLAGFALLLTDARGFYARVEEGWSGILYDMGIAIDEFALRVFNAWNSMLAGLQLPSFVYTALRIDKTKAEAELADLKARQDALQRRAHERETGTGQFEPPAAKAAREANTGVQFFRNGPGDLSEVQQAVARDLERMRFGGGPGSGPYRIDDAGGPAPFPTAATAAVPQNVTHDNHVDVGGVRVQQNITVPPGTTEEQARELGRGAAGGVKDAVNTRQIEAALSHTAG